jgi:hypothetical protein
MKLGRRRFLARAPTLIAGMDPTGGPFQNPRSRNLGPPNKGFPTPKGINRVGLPALHNQCDLLRALKRLQAKWSGASPYRPKTAFRRVMVSRVDLDT